MSENYYIACLLVICITTTMRYYQQILLYARISVALAGKGCTCEKPCIFGLQSMGICLQRESSMPWSPMKFPDMHYILYHQTSYFKATIYTYKNMYSQVQKNKHDKFLVDTVNTLKRGVFCHSNASIPAHSIHPSCARDSTIQ